MDERAITARTLGGAPLFSAFTDEVLDAIICVSDLADFDSGEVIFLEGGPGTDLFFIVSGGVRVNTLTEDGFERPIATLGAGTCVGEMAFLDGGVRSATAVVTGPSQLMRLDKQALAAVERDYPGTRVKFLEQAVSLLSRRLRDSNSSYWDFARRSMRNQMEAAQAKSRLLSLVSHELRTPLTIIKSSGQVLRRIEIGPGADFVEKILHQADHLQLLIDDLIMLAFLRTDSGIAEATEFDGAELMSEIVDELSPRAREKGVRITVFRDVDPTLVVADRALLRGAVRHLVDNAVKFAPRDTRIQLEVAADPGGEARVSVQDEGVGVPEEALARLRQSFVQSQDPLNREVEGLGIGLSLAHEVIDAHGGKLLVESSPGRGCRFTLAWPQPSHAAPLTSMEERSVQNV